MDIITCLQKAKATYLNLFGCIWALPTQLGHANSCSQGSVDAWVAGKLGRQRAPTGRARLFSLSSPLVEATQAEIVLAWSLQARDPRSAGAQTSSMVRITERRKEKQSVRNLRSLLCALLTVTGRLHSSMHIVHLSDSSNIVAVLAAACPSFSCS